MKKFTFDLQDVLEYRQFEQENAEAELGKAVAVETGIQNQLNQIAIQYTSVKNQMKNNSNFLDYVTANQYYLLMESKKEELLKELAEAKIITEEKRNILKKIMQKTEALSKLKEDELKEYKASVEHEEEETVDDIVTSRYRM